MITKIRLSDEQRFRCTATNNFVNSKSQFISLTTVQPSMTAANNSDEVDDKSWWPPLLPMLQSANVNVRRGDELKLLCAISDGAAINKGGVGAAADEMALRWSFTPRNSSIPIPLIDMMGGIQLRYRNVSRHQHEGVYKCWTNEQKNSQVINYVN